MVERLLLAAALAAALPPQALADTFACRGRDPAWELLGQGDQAMLTRDRTPGHRLLTGKSATLQAEGVVVWRGRSTDGQPDVVVTMLKGACTDPRAGDISGYLGIVSPSNGDPFVGCCSFGPQPVTTADASPPAPSAPPARAVAAPAPLQAPEPQVDDAPAPAPAPAAHAELPAPPPAPPAPAAGAAPAKPAAAFRPGSTARVAADPTSSVRLRARPDAHAPAVGTIPGGREVVVRDVEMHGGEAWYRVKGRGVPATAWLRGDLLEGG